MGSLNLKLIENELLTLRNKVMERVGLIAKDKERKSGPLPQDFSEQSVAKANDQVIDNLDEIERDELSKINKALNRIKQGSYGKCDSCGEVIQAKRIKAVPYATECMNCAVNE